MKTITGVGLAIALVACGADVGNFAADVAEDAGQLLQDAGQALSDAGGRVGDSGIADAQTPAKRTMQIACKLERSYQLGGAGSVVSKEYFASFDVAAEDIRTVWVCDRRTPGSVFPCPAGQACTGATVPASKCDPAAYTEGVDGRIWVHCGEQYQQARVILD